MFNSAPVSFYGNLSTHMQNACLCIASLVGIELRLGLGLAYIA